jgi:hypothetical protein
MKIIRFGILALLMTVCAVSQTLSAQKDQTPGSDWEKFIGAWSRFQGRMESRWQPVCLSAC